MTRICLDQGWLANAACHFFFVSDLEALDTVCGPRGYRYAMLTAGRLGHRVYLGATALDLACCGIGAFYDSEAADLLGLSGGRRMLYLLGAGPSKSPLR
jgi:nitroreductase